jgi:DNA-directed RNA polymerase subunit M/transcription elongation factor TFIIS
VVVGRIKDEVKTDVSPWEETAMVNCPLCDAVMDVEEDEIDEGDEFTCEECGAELTVTGTDPLEIEPLAEDEDEDEEDDDDLDEDEDEEAEEEDEDTDDWK